MPQIIDYAYNYTTVATATTIACDVPDTTTGDILIAILTQDTGATPAWTCTGWTRYYTLTDTTASCLMWRVSTGASEPLSYTFTSPVAETYNCVMISIRDVDTTTPFITQVSATRASHNTAFPSVTTTRNNSLILYISGHPSTAVIPSSIEGPVTQLFQMDGSAHSDSIGWTIKAVAGATGTGVSSSVTGTTYGGMLITLAVQPPAGGATLLPAYCVSDASVLLDPLHGTTAFRGNAAPAATATTYYTGTTGGKTVAAATITARTDTGINSFRSTAGQTSSTNRTWQGIAEQFAAPKTTLAGKNILCHVQTYLPADIQTLEGIGLSRGVAVGLHSSAGNFKVWHVHGANTPFGVKMTPVVVNTANTSGVIQTTGTLNTASIAGVGMLVSGFVASADMIWTMMWMLDTTVVSGGNATTPVNVPGIVRTIADGKERISALQQGKNQMLVLQPFQVGDGGTNPLYLNISAAAIEFPQQYNVASAQVFYCSTDNVAGVTFYPGATDTIDISSATFSSSSRFHWKWHTSSSTSATILMEGCQVIGAGTVELKSGLTYTEVSFNNYVTILASGVPFYKCVFTSPPSNSTAITSNESTSFNECSINTKAITAGNGWISVANPSIITNSEFTGSATTGHAIVITTPGTYSFSGNLFTGYGATASTSAAIYNNSGGLVTLNIAGGGSVPTYRNGASATTNIVSSNTVTFTGLPTGTDIVVLTAGTSTILTSVDGNAGTSWGYTYSGAQNVDVGFIKLGYVPQYIRGLALTTTDSSIPVSLTADRNFI